MISALRYTMAGLCLSFLSSCFGGGCNVIPNVTFRSSSISLSSHPQVFATNGWVYLDGGVCGLIVYNTGNDRLIAYDRCSTVSPEKKNRVKVEGILVVDDQSGATWLLKDGSPTHIAECALRQYGVNKQGSLYYVYN